MTTLDEYFAGRDDSRAIFDAVRGAVNAIGATETRVTKSQVAFRREKPVAIVWVPGQYLRGNTAPLVLTLSFPTRDPSPRWKEVVKVGARRFTHHLELRSPEDVDAEVSRWLRQAWDHAVA
jgi:hypothetical protein